MFHFCFLANIVGALIAIFTPTFAIGWSSFWSIHYVAVHSLVIAVPALAMGLRIFPRLTKKSLLYMWVGFSIYFTVVFVLGTILNGYTDKLGMKVNYFYMFDLKMAFKYVSFLAFAEEYRFAFGRFEVYPIVIGTVYVAYQLICMLFYALVKWFYLIEDDNLALRLSAIEMREERTGKPTRRPKQFID